MIRSNITTAIFILIISFCIGSASDVQAETTAIHINCQPTTAECKSIVDIFNKLPKKNSISAIKTVLDSLGYSHAQYDSSTNTVTPGDRTIIIGEEITTNDTTLRTFPQTVHYPVQFTLSQVDERAQAINRVCVENGYPFASVTIETKLISTNPQRDSLILLFSVKTDQRCRFASPRFRTVHKTSPVLLKQYITIKEDQLFDIRTVEKSLEQIKTCSIVASVNTPGPLLLPDTLSSADSSALVTIPFQIEDRSGLGFEGALGFESDQDNEPALRGSATLSLLNMFHSAEALSFEYEGSDEMQLFDIILSKPWLFNLPLNASVNFGMEIETDTYGYVYGNLKLLTTLGIYWQSGLGVSYTESSSKTDSVTAESSYLGFNFLLLRTNGTFTKGIRTSSLSLTVGSGIAKKEKNYSRSNVNFEIGTHIPLFRSQAIMAKLNTAHIITTETSLLTVEKNRFGGNSTLRGYSENEFAFRTALIGQSEIIHYYSETGALFILFDGGIGFADDINIDNHNWTKLFGYGAGIRMPSRVGLITLEWARNYSDTKSLGRIHLQFQTELSRLTEKFM